MGTEGEGCIVAPPAKQGPPYARQCSVFSVTHVARRPDLPLCFRSLAKAYKGDTDALLPF